MAYFLGGVIGFLIGATLISLSGSFFAFVQFMISRKDGTAK